MTLRNFSQPMRNRGHITSDTMLTLRRGARGSVKILLLSTRAALNFRTSSRPTVDPCLSAGRSCDDPARCNSDRRPHDDRPTAAPNAPFFLHRSPYASSPPQRKNGKATRHAVTHKLAKTTSNAGNQPAVGGSAFGWGRTEGSSEGKEWVSTCKMRGGAC